MSDVRLSDATVERVDAPQQNSRPPVCRNLFGTPDREEIRGFLTASIGDDVQAFIERYNFNPLGEGPLPAGNYEWTEDPDAPEFFSRPPHVNSSKEGPSSGGAAKDQALEAEQPEEQ
uniref:cyclin-dependent kinase inhibitor 1Ba n=1 Tax=Doryrhamphus excisus TaxID=161450 RepID=UPI0025ADD1C7|nr:cyclin-dependent kinase inhibitor 1Ba [Doryrhamphus excisus]